MAFVATMIAVNLRVMRLARLGAAGVAAIVVGSTAPGIIAGDDLVQKTRDAYAALKSYADTGTVQVDYGTSSHDRHTFVTAISRTPRGFFFEFTKQGGDRFVIWGDPDAYHTWWKTTGVQEDYPNPRNIGAFATAGPQTAGAALIVPSMWYAKGAVVGPLNNFNDAVVDGKESVGGYECYRLVGTAYDVYGATGRQTNFRKLTMWIDAKSSLIRRLVEIPKDVLPGQIDRRTTTFDPQDNPTVDPGRFKFTAPKAK